MYPEQLVAGMIISFTTRAGVKVEGMVKYVSRLYIDVSGIAYLPHDMTLITRLENK